uniref:Uncharacterized protein n=1 Tax=Setaria italica TaxID=4555 RepID=K3XKP1_SETIT
MAEISTLQFGLGRSRLISDSELQSRSQTINLLTTKRSLFTEATHIHIPKNTSRFRLTPETQKASHRSPYSSCWQCGHAHRRNLTTEVELLHRIEEGVVGALDLVLEVVHLDLVVLELAPAPSGSGLPLADEALVRAADGGLGVVGGLARRLDEPAVGRGGALDLHGARAGLALRVHQAAVDGEHPPVLATLATHRAGLPWLLWGIAQCATARARPVPWRSRVRVRVRVSNLASKSLTAVPRTDAGERERRLKLGLLYEILLGQAEVWMLGLQNRYFLVSASVRTKLH